MLSFTLLAVTPELAGHAGVVLTISYDVKLKLNTYRIVLHA